MCVLYNLSPDRFFSLKKITLFIIFLLSCLSLNLKAQSSVTGCLLPNNNIYTDDWTGGGITDDYWFKFDPYKSLPKKYCSWVATKSEKKCSTCSEFKWDPKTKNYICSGKQQMGVYATFKPVFCPIDDYIPFLLLVLGGTSVFFLRGRNCFIVM